MQNLKIFKILNKTLQVDMATLALIQAMVTVWAGVLFENPADNAASRATLDVLTSWMTVPKTI